MKKMRLTCTSYTACAIAELCIALIFATRDMCLGFGPNLTFKYCLNQFLIEKLKNCSGSENNLFLEYTDILFLMLGRKP